MSTLSISLIVLVVATLAVVAGFNLFQNRGSRPRAGARTMPAAEPVAPVNAPAETVAAAAPRGEPTLGLDTLVETTPAAGPRDDPSLGLHETPQDPHDEAYVDDPGDASPVRTPEPVQSQAPPPASSPSTPRPMAGAAVLSELADCLVELDLPSPVAGERLLTMLQPIRRVGAKPVLFEGRPTGTEDDETPPWASIAPGAAYGRLRGGVLMANRHGPLNAMEYSEFESAMKALADHLHAQASALDMNRTLERARDLDSVCMQLDAQVGLNVDCPEALSPADLERLAEAQRLVERGNNRYARLGPRGEVLFSVSLADEPQRLTFLLDVPRALAQHRPWDQLVDCARAVADRLQGNVVDDGGRVLPDVTLARIGQQLQQRYDSLAQAGFPAGSTVALRLFN